MGSFRLIEILFLACIIAATLYFAVTHVPPGCYAGAPAQCAETRR